MELSAKSEINILLLICTNGNKSFNKVFFPYILINYSMNIISEIKSDYEIIIDKSSVHIINYTKIIDISYFNITIELTNRRIKLIGESLVIRKLDEKELIIDGLVKGIEFISG